MIQRFLGYLRFDYKVILLNCLQVLLFFYILTSNIHFNVLAYIFYIIVFNLCVIGIFSLLNKDYLYIHLLMYDRYKKFSKIKLILFIELAVLTLLMNYFNGYLNINYAFVILIFILSMIEFYTLEDYLYYN